MKNIQLRSQSLFVTWNEKIDNVLCLFHNCTTGVKKIFQWQLNDQWIVHSIDNVTDLRVHIYGVSNSGHVVVSNMRKFYSDNDQTQAIILNKHLVKNSIMNISNTSLVSPKMLTTVDQCIQENSTPYLVFKCSENNLKLTYKYIQLIQLETNSFYEYINIKTTENQEIPCAWSLPSRCKITYQIYEIHSHTVVRESGIQSITTHNTKNDVARLYKLAENYRQEKAKKTKCSKSLPVHCLYRNKPNNHPTILEMKNTGIMRKYIKDNNGDQASSINNQIKGLFFSASLDQKTKKPPNFSFFGDYRIRIPPKFILPYHNLYFADFYCQAPRRKHYGTLVLTKPDSVEDKYCKDRLVELSLYDNKFLYYQSSCTECPYRSTKAMHVEVLYTEDVHVSQMKQEGSLHEETIDKVRGRGHSKESGIPKCTACEICNLK